MQNLCLIRMWCVSVLMLIPLRSLAIPWRLSWRHNPRASGLFDSPAGDVFARIPLVFISSHWFGIFSANNPNPVRFGGMLSAGRCNPERKVSRNCPCYKRFWLAQRLGAGPVSGLNTPSCFHTKVSNPPSGSLLEASALASLPNRSR